MEDNYSIDVRTITVRFDLAGMHNYPQASKNHDHSVGFLEHPHRHRFYFEVTVPVSHAERELEFFLFQEVCYDAVVNSYPLCFMYVDFESRSCEKIAINLAKEILGYYETVSWCKVTVSEDKENDATVIVRKIRESHRDENHIEYGGEG